MITLLTGDNTFEINEALVARTAGFDGDVERFDGEEVSPHQLADILLGQSLFASKRLIVLKNPTDNKELWSLLPEWLERAGESLDLLLVQPSVDKRTVTYKWLKKHADVQEYITWAERDTSKAETWTLQHAKTLGTSLDKKVAHVLVERTGVDQWRIHHALEKLSLLDKITEQSVLDMVELNPSENIFVLFETALKGDARGLHAMISSLSLTEDAYKVMGLLASQAVQLLTLAVADKPSSDVASDIGAHPFVLSKLAPHAKRLGTQRADEIVKVFATADMRLKTSDADPWAVIENALLQTSK